MFLDNGEQRLPTGENTVTKLNGPLTHLLREERVSSE